MSWWEWTLLWTVLVLGSLAVLGWLGFRVVRAGLGLLGALGLAADTLAGVMDAVEGTVQGRVDDRVDGRLDAPGERRPSAHPPR